MNQKKMEQQREKLRRMPGWAVAVILFLLLLLAAFFFIVHSLNLIGRSDTGRIDASEETFETDDLSEGHPDVVDPKDVQWAEVDTLGDDDLINILLVGQDRRPGETRQRSDSMIVVSMNPETKEISMISFLRDLYVRIPGYSDNRLNAAYAFGGFELLQETLLANFGVTVDACFEVDFDGFEAVIDAVGGVDVELTAAEARYIGKGTRAGNNHLNGEAALAYARIRKLDSDFGRTQRQRNILLSLAEKARKSSLPELLKLADALIPQLTTDLTNTQIVTLITQAYPILHDTTKEIATYHVPADNAYYNATIRGMMVLVPNLPMIRGQLETYFPLSTTDNGGEQP